jgi:hypothetical protein
VWSITRFTYEFSQASATAYQALYKDHHGLRKSFCGYWEQVEAHDIPGSYRATPCVTRTSACGGGLWPQLARLFKGVAGVLGFEIMNEPFAGDVVKNPLLLYPGVADMENLQEFYDVVNDAVREVDEDRLLFFESVTWSDTCGCHFTSLPSLLICY